MNMRSPKIDLLRSMLSAKDGLAGNVRSAPRSSTTPGSKPSYAYANRSCEPRCGYSVCGYRAAFGVLRQTR